MKRIFLYACALVVLGLFLAAMAASCVPNGPGSPAISTPPRMTPATIEQAMATWYPPTAMPTLMPSFTPIPEAQVWHYLFLGVDNGPGRPQNKPGGAGNKTDVILLVTVRDENPLHITITQFPRNLWVDQYPTDLLFEVYRKYGFKGTTTYFYDVFGIELTGIAAVDMTTFVKYVDDLEGVTIEGEAMDGAELLKWLRDIDNNWNGGIYDAGMRQHRALVAVLDRAYNRFAAKDFLVSWQAFSKVETDLDFLEYVDAASTALFGARYGMSVDYARLTTPIIARDEVPMPPWRAETAKADLREWMAGIVGR